MVDLCAGYGVNAALLRFRVTLDDLYTLYDAESTPPLHAGVSLEDWDRRFFASRLLWQRVHRPRGRDRQGGTCSSNAESVGLVDYGASEDLEDGEPSTELRRRLLGANLVTITGGMGYIGPRTMGTSSRTSDRPFCRGLSRFRWSGLRWGPFSECFPTSACGSRSGTTRRSRKDALRTAKTASISSLTCAVTRRRRRCRPSIFKRGCSVRGRPTKPTSCRSATSCKRRSETRRVQTSQVCAAISAFGRSTTSISRHRMIDRIAHSRSRRRARESGTECARRDGPLPSRDYWTRERNPAHLQRRRHACGQRRDLQPRRPAGDSGRGAPSKPRATARPSCTYSARMKRGGLPNSMACSRLFWRLRIESSLHVIRLASNRCSWRALAKALPLHRS